MDPIAKLDTGMRVDEAIRRAQAWWAEWRGAIREGFNQATDTKAIGPGKRVPGIVVHTAHKDYLPSGILSGKRWDKLTEAEQLQIVKIWHHNHVRDPMSADFEYRQALREAYNNATAAQRPN